MRNRSKTNLFDCERWEQRSSLCVDVMVLVVMGRGGGSELYFLYFWLNDSLYKNRLTYNTYYGQSK